MINATPVAPAATSTALLVKLSARPDFSAVEAMPRGAARKQAAYDAIVATAAESQKPLVALAEQLKASGAVKGYELLVSPNMLVVTPNSGKTQAVADAFFGAAGVKAIYSNNDGKALTKGKPVPSLAPGKPTWGLDVLPKVTDVTTEAPPARPYGIYMICAPSAWEQKADGLVIVFGSNDTCADF
jgi:hypothetical protein